MGNLKIEIKSIYGSVLFSYEKEENTVKQTLIEAVKNKADLRGAYLQGADLQGAYLQGAYLRGAYLRGADLRGAKYGEIEIEKSEVFTGLYKYVVMPIIAKDGTKYVRLGCHCRKVSGWEKDFWNNNNEFPNNGSYESNSRYFAFKTCLEWFKMVEKTNK